MRRYSRRSLYITRAARGACVPYGVSSMSHAHTAVRFAASRFTIALWHRVSESLSRSPSIPPRKGSWAMAVGMHWQSTVFRHRSARRLSFLNRYREYPGTTERFVCIHPWDMRPRNTLVRRSIAAGVMFFLSLSLSMLFKWTSPHHIEQLRFCPAMNSDILAAGNRINVYFFSFEEPEKALRGILF